MHINSLMYYCIAATVVFTLRHSIDSVSLIYTSHTLTISIGEVACGLTNLNMFCTIPFTSSYSLFHIGWVCCSSSFQRSAEGTLDYWTTAYVALTAFHWYSKKSASGTWCTTCYPFTVHLVQLPLLLETRRIQERQVFNANHYQVKEWIGKRWNLSSLEL